jgi:hypothetical protein
MRRQPRGFEPFRFARSTEGQLVIGFFVLLYVVGGALIWSFYGMGGAVLGWICITGGLLFFLLLYAIVSAIGWWANREYKD